MQGSQVGAKVEMADSVLKAFEIDVDLNVIAQRERGFALWQQAFDIGRSDSTMWGNDADGCRNDFATWGNDTDTREIRSAIARNDGFLKLTAFLFVLIASSLRMVTWFYGRAVAIKFVQKKLISYLYAVYCREEKLY